MKKIGDCCTDEYGNLKVDIGDVVESNEAIFVVGDININTKLVIMDKKQQFKLKDENSYFASCIKSGNYAVIAPSLKFSEL